MALDLSDEDCWFGVVLLKIEMAPNYTYDALKKNATWVAGPYWIFEGELWSIGVPTTCVVAHGAVPTLGGRTKEELIEICKVCLAYEIQAA